MKTILATLVTCATAVAAASPAKAPVTINAAEMKFGAAPPTLPAGAQLAVLHGDPGARGVFAMRLKMPDGYRIPPHWHSNDEELSVLSGSFLLTMGDKAADPASTHTLEAGAYHFLPAKMHHSAEAKGETVLEIHGSGPFDIHYLNTADDPARSAAAGK